MSDFRQSQVSTGSTVKKDMELDPARCYRALASRDLRFDGRFFVGVRSTGVYCRPICPARTPRAENVTFFVCAAAAEAAGFRPCRRCRPDTTPGTPAWSGTSAIVQRALRLISEGALDEGTLEMLAGRLGLGARQLRRHFLRHVGASPMDVARARRVHFARTLLEQTPLPITEVAFAAGFRSVRQFNASLQQTYGRSPRILRRERTVNGMAKQRDGLTLRLPYRPPLDWAWLLGFLGRRATPGVEIVRGNTYCRAIPLQDGIGRIEITRAPETQAICLHLIGGTQENLIRVTERARHLFDLDADPVEIGRHLRATRLLRPLAAASPGLRVPGAWNPFELAVRAIIGQQVSVAAATTIMGRVAGRWGRPIAGAGVDLTHLFPEPAVLAEADLGQIGLPRARAQALRALAGAVAAGTLRLDGGDALDATVARLRALPGVGAWTVQYIALRALREPDAFPAADLGLRKAAGGGVPVPVSVLETMAESWRPWRAYAAVHLWASLTRIRTRREAPGRTHGRAVSEADR
jgi:AraC family transcriptional regulator, regulatory protein of adaptative response / DNA-3-methyladenine glycosylase II